MGAKEIAKAHKKIDAVLSSLSDDELDAISETSLVDGILSRRLSKSGKQFLPTAHSFEDKIIVQMVYSELSHFVRDILSHATIEGLPVYLNVYEKGVNEHIAKLQVTAFDVLMNIIIGREMAYHSITVQGHSLITDHLPRTTHTLNQSLVVPPADKGMWFQLYKLFLFLHSLYISLEKAANAIAKTNDMIFFKPKGLTALLGGDDMNKQRITNIMEAMTQQIDKAVSDDYGIIDGDTAIDVIGASAASAVALRLTEGFDFFKHELARLLKRPLTELFGESPKGFNSGNYEERSNIRQDIAYIELYLKPVIEKLGGVCTVNTPIEIDHVNRLLNTIERVKNIDDLAHKELYISKLGLMLDDILK